MASIRNQFLKGQALPLSPKKHSGDPVQSMIVHRPLIQPEGEFVNVASQVLVALTWW